MPPITSWKPDHVGGGIWRISDGECEFPSTFTAEGQAKKIAALLNQRDTLLRAFKELPPTFWRLLNEDECRRPDDEWLDSGQWMPIPDSHKLDIGRLSQQMIRRKVSFN